MLKPSSEPQKVTIVQPPPLPKDIPIHDAAYEGNIEAVKHHLAAGTDVNAKSKKAKLTPLFGAAFSGHKEIAELLIAKGADVNATTADGLTALFTAIIEGHKEIAELLIAKGADVNAKADDGFTPLHIAETKEIAELLIAKGADVNAKDVKGRTPLDAVINRISGWKSGVRELTRLDETGTLLRKHGGKTSEELEAEGK